MLQCHLVDPILTECQYRMMGSECHELRNVDRLLMYFFGSSWLIPISCLKPWCPMIEMAVTKSLVSYERRRLEILRSGHTQGHVFQSQAHATRVGATALIDQFKLWVHPVSRVFPYTRA